MMVVAMTTTHTAMDGSVAAGGSFSSAWTSTPAQNKAFRLKVQALPFHTSQATPRTLVLAADSSDSHPALA
jgi:hypothetical protein